MNFDELIPEDVVEDGLEGKLVFENFDDTETPWIWNNKPIAEIPQNSVSFVYRITNTITHKFYIGYKGLTSKRTKIVKGKKKHLIVESDWKSYWSSGDALHRDINYYGIGNYKREILAFCPNKAVGKYLELVLQIKNGVLTFNAENSFNGIVNVRLGSATLKRYKEIIFCEELKGFVV